MINMKKALLLLILAAMSAAMIGCSSEPQPEPEKPVQGKVEEVPLESVASESKTSGNTVEKEGAN